ncbi:hypothetical protein [Bacteroides sp. 519]|uniref:hypothetical protein n=1 Tax=Bacteroides sp. 519 TaxID=2302937 RepID=UPI0013D6CC1A|nr:hypothetical protein [Bacteroides sp. 519]NDV58122.1 hypothetical protein [Bacteroides sp. 519]
MKNIRITKSFCCIIILLFLFSVPFISAQNPQFKYERRIYLWDVTLSMKGYQGNTPNIYDEVVKAIKTDINSIADEDTEIIVLPFQVSILEEWREKATEEGKRNIIQKIEKYKNDKITNTNICYPLSNIMQKYLSNDKRNVLLLLTDGKHTPTAEYPKDCLIELIRSWCEFASETDSYAFYVMLTQFAKDEELIRVISETCRINAVEGTNINFIELYPYTIGKYNIKDDEGKTWMAKVECKKHVRIPDGIKIKLKAIDDKYFDVDTIVDLRDNNFKFNLRQRYTYEELQELLPHEENRHVRIAISIANQQDFPLVSLLLDEIDFEYVYKPEKTLKIYVQD